MPIDDRLLAVVTASVVSLAVVLTPSAATVCVASVWIPASFRACMTRNRAVMSANALSIELAMVPARFPKASPRLSVPLMIPWMLPEMEDVVSPRIDSVAERACSL
ncbi:hypothetical protein D3C76_1345010 [compost metagenome]